MYLYTLYASVVSYRLLSTFHQIFSFDSDCWNSCFQQSEKKTMKKMTKSDEMLSVNDRKLRRLIL